MEQKHVALFSPFQRIADNCDRALFLGKLMMCRASVPSIPEGR
jgi:hypothetical protein